MINSGSPQFYSMAAGGPCGGSTFGGPLTPFSQAVGNGLHHQVGAVPPYYPYAGMQQQTIPLSNRHYPTNHNYRLYYFDSRGRGEVIRLLFSFANVPYKDKRVKQDEWSTLKEQMPLNQLPVLKIDGGFKLPQTNAIVRYLANEFRLLGNNQFDHAIIDSILETNNDLKVKILPLIDRKDPEQQRQSVKKFLDDGEASQHLKRLEKLFINYGRHGPFYLGSHVSLADLVVYDGLYYIIDAEPKVLDNYPKLKENRKRLEKHPQMANYLGLNQKRKQRSSHLHHGKSSTPVNPTSDRREHSYEQRHQHRGKSPTPVNPTSDRREHSYEQKHQHSGYHNNVPSGDENRQTIHHHGTRQSKSPSLAVNDHSEEKSNHETQSQLLSRSSTNVPDNVSTHSD